MIHALEAFLAARALADWKEGGPVKVTAESAAARAEADFFRLLFEQREKSITTTPAPAAG
jgi:hypothetical protein